MPENNSRLALSTLVLIILFLPGFVLAESTRVLRGGYIDFPPLSYTDASGQAAGEGIELPALPVKRALRHQQEIPAAGFTTVFATT